MLIIRVQSSTNFTPRYSGSAALFLHSTGSATFLLHSIGSAALFLHSTGSASFVLHSTGSAALFLHSAGSAAFFLHSTGSAALFLHSTGSAAFISNSSFQMISCPLIRKLPCTRSAKERSHSASSAGAFILPLKDPLLSSFPQEDQLL